MLEIDQWIYSRDIAEWLLTRPPLDLAGQMDCILSAPHRNLEEKLDFQGKIIYCLPEYSRLKESLRGNGCWVGPQDDLYLMLPYSTGTIVETAENPFFRSVKGVVMNQREPWEEGFAEDNEQWLLYKDNSHMEKRTGIGAVKLDNDYASMVFGADYILPFRQFLRRCEGKMEESEGWMTKLGELVRKDKRCFVAVMKDNMPVHTPGEKERNQEYVESLAERWERGDLLV